MRLLYLTSMIIGICLTFSIYAKEIAGVSEIITLLPDKIKLDAKVDTGADSSSLDARNIEYFTKENIKWVRFDIARNLNGKPYQLEYPLERTVKIVSRVSTEKLVQGKRKSHSRPVVKMDICIGNEIRTIEVNLFNRSNFKFPFLLGVSGLAAFDFLVDVEAKHLLPGKCVAKTQ